MEMHQPVFSEANISLVREHLEEFGRTLAANTEVRTQECVGDLFSIINALIDDGMVAYATIDSENHTMTRLVVVNKLSKARLITLTFAPKQRDMPS